MASETENNAGGNKKVIDAIIRYQAGETEAFTDFYLGTEKMVLKFCLDMLHNKEDAEDVSQMVYTRAYRKLDLLNDPKAYGQWLKVISVNLCKNFIEKDSKNKTTDIDEYQNYEENGWDDFDNLPDYFIEDEQKREIIDKILKESLSDVQFQTLWLRYFADKSEQEIAGIMGCSLGTVKSRTNSAKTKFRESLEKYVDKNKIVLSAVPFLTRYLKYQGTGKAMKGVPSVPIAASTAKAAGAAKTAGAATVKAGFLYTTAGKAVITVAAVAAVTVAGGIIMTAINNKTEELPAETEASIAETTTETTFIPVKADLPEANKTDDPDEVGNKGRQLGDRYLVRVDCYDPDGSASWFTKYDYDEAGYLVKYTVFDDDGKETRWDVFERDANGLLIFDGVGSDEDGIVFSNEYQYNSAGYMTVMIPNVGEPEYYEYDDNGILTGMTDEDGVTEYEYDASGNLIKETIYWNHIAYKWTEFEYDEYGNRVRNVQYDKDGNVIIGAELEYEYDDSGRVVFCISHNTRGEFTGSCGYEYDEDGYLVKKITYDENRNVTCWYEYRYLDMPD